MEFYLIKNQSYLLHRIIQKTYLSIITTLFCVRFDVVITDIKTKMFSWPWPPCEYIYIYTYGYACFVCIYMYMYMYVCYFYFISFISLSMSETNIRPCIALWKIALYWNVALLLVPLHPVLKTIYLEIEIRAHKPRLPALIVMKDCYQFFFLIYCTFTCLQLVKIV